MSLNEFKKPAAQKTATPAGTPGKLTLTSGKVKPITWVGVVLALGLAGYAVTLYLPKPPPPALNYQPLRPTPVTPSTPSSAFQSAGGTLPPTPGLTPTTAPGTNGNTTLGQNTTPARASSDLPDDSKPIPGTPTGRTNAAGRTPSASTGSPPASSAVTHPAASGAAGSAHPQTTVQNAASKVTPSIPAVTPSTPSVAAADIPDIFEPAPTGSGTGTPAHPRAGVRAQVSAAPALVPTAPQAAVVPLAPPVTLRAAPLSALLPVPQSAPQTPSVMPLPAVRGQALPLPAVTVMPAPLRLITPSPVSPTVPTATVPGSGAPPVSNGTVTSGEAASAGSGLSLLATSTGDTPTAVLDAPGGQLVVTEGDRVTVQHQEFVIAHIALNKVVLQHGDTKITLTPESN